MQKLLLIMMLGTKKTWWFKHLFAHLIILTVYIQYDFETIKYVKEPSVGG